MNAPNLMVKATPFPHPYKMGTKIETRALGDGYSIGVEINIAIPHELSQDESWDIQDAADKLLNLLRRGAEKADPVAVARQNDENQELLNLFPAGSGYKAIPNEYDPTRCVNPWFIVYTTRGPIKIGWRKRVINIDWSDSLIQEDGQKLFPDEDVTKGYGKEKYIHAHGIAKAYEYVTTLMSAIIPHAV